MFSWSTAAESLAPEVEGVLRNCLDPAEHQLLRLRFGIGGAVYDREVIGRWLGISTTRAQRVELEALRKLRQVSLARAALPTHLIDDLWDEA